ncbi:MAG TPA: acyl-CoA dehydrogenase family protein [Candidatus Angelobacter sp.]|jgi:alkylation response protein AidB-like acyl-CoA dehydrogenase|nr:acyl-CoA dehydrogenase family protein [Candidatus Angelobacter sp.]
MLIDELKIASKRMPELVKALSTRDMMDLENSGSESVTGLLRAHGAPEFLVPRDLGGGGGSLLEITQIMRVVGSRCPSLSIMMTMHHHTVAAIARGMSSLSGGAACLKRVARERALVASAFAEGRPGADTLDSTVRCTQLDGGAGFRVVGSKKPSSMSHHANFACVGVLVDIGGQTGRGIALVDRALDGTNVSDFWTSEILASADCHCLKFEGVLVPHGFVLVPFADGKVACREGLVVAHAEIVMSCLFQVLISASYLGMATRLCESVLKKRGGTSAQRVEILSRLESAAAAIYHLAASVEKSDISAYLLGKSMLVACNTAAQIEYAVALSVKALGGSGYLSSKEAQYLVLASHCLDFHPPSRQVREEIIDGCYTELI